MDYEIAIIGAGFGGLIAAVNLQDAGISSFIILEKAAALGGVWRENNYPGAGCDVRSDFYSIKGLPNPNWSHHFSDRKEILDYLHSVADKRNLEKHIRFNYEVSSMQFSSQNGYWKIDSDTNESIYAKIVILATGPFRLPVIPSISRLDGFKGAYFHSSKWNDKIALVGKNVVVIGTGSSAAQIIPAIAPLVNSLQVIQRTPGWVLYKWNGKRSTFKRMLFAKLPFLQKLSRTIHFWILELVGLLFMNQKTIHSFFSWLALHKLKTEVTNPTIRKQLTPDYPLGCKRIILSDDYLSTFNRNNVFLTTGSVTEIYPDYVKVGEKKIAADVIVFATGFNVANLDSYINIIGINGINLVEGLQNQDPEAFLGLQFSGFPHLCMQLGPNSGLYHTSVLHVIESQMKYIIQLSKYLKSEPNKWIDVNKKVQTAYYKNIQDSLRKTIWSKGCTGWYLNRRGMNVVHYPHLAKHYRKNTAQFNISHYDVHNSIELQININP